MPSPATHGLILAAYSLLIVALGLVLRQVGAWDASFSTGVILASLVFAMLCHGAVARAAQVRIIEDEFAELRRANLILAEEVEDARDKIERLAASVEKETQMARRNRASERQLLENLVERLSVVVESKREAAAKSDGPPEMELDEEAFALDAVRRAVEANRVDLHLQPIVSLPQRKARYYEAFARLRSADGSEITASDYLAPAERAGLIPIIDSLLLFRSVQLIRQMARRDKSIRLFCNISLRTLRDPNFTSQFLDYLSQNRDLKDCLIFELTQSAFDHRTDGETAALEGLVKLGFVFSLDQVVNIDIDLPALKENNVRYIKVSAERLIRILTADHGAQSQGALDIETPKDIRAEDFKELLNRYNLDLIADRIETENQVVEVLDLFVDFGQGYLFGEPRLAKSPGVSDEPEAGARSNAA